MEPIYITQNQNRVQRKLDAPLLVLLGTIACLFFLWNDVPVLVRVALISCLLFCVPMCIYYITLLRDPDCPLIVIDQDGVTDRTNPFAVGLIRWEEIEDEREYRSGKQPTLRLDVNDPKAILDRLSPIKRLIARGQISLKEYSVTIHLDLIAGPRLNEVVYKIRSARAQLTGNPMPPQPQPISAFDEPDFNKYNE